MKPYLKISCSLALILQLSILPTFAFSEEKVEDKRVIVKFRDSVDSKVIKDVNGKLDHKLKHANIAIVDLPSNEIKDLKKNPKVEYIEEDQRVKLSAQTPDWGISATKAPQAWSAGFTGKNVKVAIFDTGIDTSHPDLVVAGGACFAEGDCANGYDDNDIDSHGTHVAGIIGAKNNSFGTVGVAPDAQLYAVKVISQDGYGYTSDIISGIDWAIENDMDIINMSFGNPFYSFSFEEAVDLAHANGITLIASSGNEDDGTGSTDTTGYPANFDNVIAVGSVDEDLNRSYFSSAGASVEFAAPGGDIYSTISDGYYDYLSGTSMASPYVVGIFALYKEQYPNATNEELRAIAQSRAIDLGDSGKDAWYGYGFIQAPAASVPSQPTGFSYSSLDLNKITLGWDVSPQVNGYEVKRDGQTVYNGTNTTFTDTGLNHNQTYTYSLTTYNQYGLSSASTFQVKMPEPTTSKITLTNAHYLFDQPYNESKTIDLIGAQAVQPIAKLGGWYKINTWIGPKWIYPFHSYVGDIEQKNMNMKNTSPLYLYDHPFTVFPTYNYVQGQTLKVIAAYNGWHQVETWLGPKWLFAVNSYIGDAVPINKTIVLADSYYLYNEAFEPFRTNHLISPQTVYAISEYNGWYKIQTWLGDKWIYPKNIFVDPPTDYNQSLYVSQQEMLYTSPFIGNETGMSIAPQTVYAVRKYNNWYEIQTWVGNMWINLGD